MVTDSSVYGRYSLRHVSEDCLSVPICDAAQTFMRDLDMIVARSDIRETGLTVQ